MVRVRVRVRVENLSGDVGSGPPVPMGRRKIWHCRGQERYEIHVFAHLFTLPGPRSFSGGPIITEA
jgi:hypothetical protein